MTVLSGKSDTRFQYQLGTVAVRDRMAHPDDEMSVRWCIMIAIIARFI